MAAAKKPRAVYPEREVYTLSDLEQVRVLADPLRMRILEALCRERTTKQVADAIGEKPTKLYHHVEALERVGLIEMTRTRQNRGTLEKYFLAVARAFRADPKLFASVSPGGPETEALQAMAVTTLEKTAGELREVISAGYTDLEVEGALCHCEIHGSPEDLQRVRAKLEELLSEVQALHDPDNVDGSERRFRLSVAYFPLDAGS